jgi:pyruvate dehydrogenase E1 component alpha subunit
MHMFSVEKGFFGGHGIVGANVSLGTGIAFAHKYNEDGGVCLTYFGDGAANQGQVAESFNMAELWGLPIVYIIENNKYGMGTSVERASARPDMHNRGAAYGIPGEKVDGMDVLAVKEAGAKAVEFVRGGNGPMILEMETYRYRGHSMSDPAKYRTKEEVQKFRTERDPIEHLKEKLIDKGEIDEDGLKAIDKEIRGIVNDAAEFAQNSPEPDPSELYTDVIAPV